MDTVYLVIVIVFVVAVLGAVGYALFEMSPFARHADQYRDPVTHERIGQSPRLD